MYTFPAPFLRLIRLVQRDDKTAAAIPPGVTSMCRHDMTVIVAGRFLFRPHILAGVFWMPVTM